MDKLPSSGANHESRKQTELSDKDSVTSKMSSTRDGKSASPLFAGIKLEYDDVIADQKKMCILCGEPVLVSYKAHPERHASCAVSPKKSSSLEDEVSSKSQSDRNCVYCGKYINIVYKSHPSLHSKCKADLQAGKSSNFRPTTKERMSDFGSSSSNSANSIADAFANEELEFEKHMAYMNINHSSFLPPERSNSAHKSELNISSNVVGFADISDEETISAILSESSYYMMLGISTDAATESIKQAYRKLALRLHPDKCSLMNGSEAFKKISEAFSCLSDPISRSRYDSSRSAFTMTPEELARFYSLSKLRSSDFSGINAMFDAFFKDLNKALFGNH